MLCRLVSRGSAVNYLLAAGPAPLLLSFLERTYLLSGWGTGSPVLSVEFTVVVLSLG